MTETTYIKKIKWKNYGYHLMLFNSFFRNLVQSYNGTHIYCTAITTLENVTKRVCIFQSKVVCQWVSEAAAAFSTPKWNRFQRSLHRIQFLLFPLPSNHSRGILALAEIDSWAALHSKFNIELRFLLWMRPTGWPICMVKTSCWLGFGMFRHLALVAELSQQSQPEILTGRMGHPLLWMRW